MAGLNSGGDNGGGGGSVATGTSTGGGNSAIDFPYSSDGKDTLDKLLASADYSEGRLRTETMADIENQMARRGLRTSGIHNTALTKTGAELSNASAAGRDSMALNVFNALNAERGQQMDYSLGLSNQSLQAQLAALNTANNQSMLNQQNRANMYGQVGGFLGNLLQPAAMNYLGDKWNLPQSRYQYNYQPQAAQYSSNPINWNFDTSGLNF
jgi:hypothetical protein